MTLRKMLVTTLLLCLPVTGCGSAHTPGSGPGTTQAPTAGPDYDAQEKANRTRAEGDARRLLALVDLPSGSVELASAPAALPGPALGMPQSDTTVDQAKYWRVPLAVAATEDYLEQHPPAGLSQWGTSSAGSVAAMTHGYGWAGTGTGSPGGQLEIGVAAISDAAGAASYLRADALTTWLDPHPLVDDAAGRRMRIEAGGRCPAEDSGMVGVRNDGNDFDRSLVPTGTPKGGLLCSYAGMNGKPFSLVLQRVLSAAEAARVAEAARRVDLGHANGVVHSCPGDGGAAAVAVLEYQNRPAANLWLAVHGCSSASNGSIRAIQSSSLAALLQIVHELSS
jgi:hypothetical protein